MTERTLIAAALLVLGAGCSGVAAPVLTIHNDSVQVQYDSATGAVTLTRPGAVRPFVTAGHMTGGGPGRVTRISDKALGKGECIDIARPDGSGDRVILYPRLPFALFQARVHNGTANPITLNKIPTLNVTVDLGKSASDLRALGTGGLAPVDKENGSYMWLTLADPATRSGVVGGWITTDRGSGVVFAGEDGDHATMQASVEYGRLRLEPGASAELETFALGYFDDARLGMEDWASTVAKVYHIHLPAQPVGYCTWYHAGSWNEKGMAGQAVFAGKNLKPYGFSVLQIDDGWQDGNTHNGPQKNFTRIRPDGPYPSGMKAMADKIRANGLTPGLWFMPFSGSHEDPWFKDHQDWFVKHEDGTPFDSPWGGACLDMTDPGAREYLRSIVSRIVHDWGYRYLKMDGLTSGAGVKHQYVNDSYKDDNMGDGVFHDPTQSNIQAFRSGLKLIRQAAGPDVFLLGCTVAQNMRAYGGAFGLVDGMRIGPDNDANWNAMKTGPRYGSRNYHLNGRIWYNDPDCVYARPSVPLNEEEVLASWVTLSGQLCISSEDFAKLPPERLDMLRRTMPSAGLQGRPADLFDTDLPRVWTMSDTRTMPRRDVIGLFNWDDAATTMDYAASWLGLPPADEYVAFDYWGNKLVGPFLDHIRQNVPGDSCVVLAIRPVTTHPEVISTSRHITQGMVDLAGEKWDARTRTLSGASTVVAGDPYELRIALHSKQGEWKAVSATAAADQAEPVIVQVRNEPGLTRVTLPSEHSGPVHWTVMFARS